MSVLTLPQAKNHLKLTGNQHDVELQGDIAAAEAGIAELCGPLVPTTVTFRLGRSRSSLTLPITPVLSLTSVTPVGGTALPLDSLALDPEYGLLGNAAGGAMHSARGYDVVYVAGRDTVPADLMLAIKERVRELWFLRHGGSTITGAPTPVRPPVEELIAPHVQITI